MKKKIILSIFALALVFAASLWGFESIKSELDYSDLTLANTEALAQGENGCGSELASAWDDPSFWYNDYHFVTCTCNEYFGRVKRWGC